MLCLVEIGRVSDLRIFLCVFVFLCCLISFQFDFQSVTLTERRNGFIDSVISYYGVMPRSSKETGQGVTLTERRNGFIDSVISYYCVIPRSSKKQDKKLIVIKCDGGIVSDA